MRISDWSSDVCSSDLVQNIKQEVIAMSKPVTLNVRIRGALGDFVMAHVGAEGSYENVSEYVRDLIRRDKERLKPSSLVASRQSLRRHSMRRRSEEHPSELQSLMRISYAVFRLKKQN